MLLDDLQRLVPQVIDRKKQFLREEFGSDLGYPIKGVVVVGSVAERRERSGSDIDVYLLLNGEWDAEDFLGELTEELSKTTNRNDLYIDKIGTVRLDRGQSFTPDTWPGVERGKEYTHSGYEVIKVD